MTNRSGEYSPADSSEQVGEAPIKVVRVSPNVTLQSEDAETAEEDAQEGDDLMPVEPGGAAEVDADESTKPRNSSQPPRLPPMFSAAVDEGACAGSGSFFA